MVDEDDPEVQRNGFETIAETVEMPEHALEEYFEEDFDPDDTWEENFERFSERWKRVKAKFDEATNRVDDADELHEVLEQEDPSGD